MNKKILISLSVISVVAAVAVGGTIAYFSNTETSAGNIFIAGSIDLKVDHTLQTYNGIDCKTCSVDIISDTSNIVTGTASGTDPVAFPHAAVLVSTPYNLRWTAIIDGASWIWATDPTTEYDAANDVIYTFEKTFDWYGPITGTSLSFVVGSDNSVEVWLNGVKIAENTSEYGYESGHVLTISNLNVEQGTNTLEFKVKNWKQTNGTWQTNPGGLLYRLIIGGNCQDDYFKTNCQLWGSTDLTDQKFFNFNDLKPADSGVNVISLHNAGNDAWVCMGLLNKVDNENGVNQSEIAAGDNATSTVGELSQNLELFIWKDTDKDGLYELGESPVGSYGFDELNRIAINDSVTGTGDDLNSGADEYLGLVWCFGNQTVFGQTITCDGSSSSYNIAQTDSFLADLYFYAEQSRNNLDFTCVQIPS
ncbi:MAG: TasA family protein [Candidatus Nealsonbacteria bacterium]|nr:TasA family protein [Candidatus Nealsonbacteria bacterium]